jgi:hypothetical protein
MVDYKSAYLDFLNNSKKLKKLHWEPRHIAKEKEDCEKLTNDDWNYIQERILFVKNNPDRASKVYWEMKDKNLSQLFIFYHFCGEEVNRMVLKEMRLDNKAKGM